MALAPTEIDALASFVCGGEGTPASYRSGVNINRFIAFTGTRVEWEPGPSRFYEAQSWLTACDATPPGLSGLPREIEKVVVALGDRRQFESDDEQQLMVEELARVLGYHEIELRLLPRRRVELVSKATTPGQEVIDEEIHTVFEKVLKDSALAPARAHYVKARRLLKASEPDYENAAKEGVCAIESLSKVLTGASDFNKAIERSIREGLLPRPLGEMVKKLYAYRGDEPGVSHGAGEVPDVDAQDAQFVVNLSAVVGLYLRGKLSS